MKRIGSTRYSGARLEGRLPEGTEQGDVTGLQGAAVVLLVPELRREPVQQGPARLLQVWPTDLQRLVSTRREVQGCRLSLAIGNWSP